MIYIDIGNNLDLDNNVYLERGHEKTSRALQQVQEAMSGEASFIPWALLVPSGFHPVFNLEWNG